MTKSPAIDCDDLLSRHGAGLLADVINAYWRERGYSAQAERVDFNGHWAVRSTLVNGLPRAVAAPVRRGRMERFT